MATIDHVIVCGESSAPRPGKSRQIIRLDLRGADANIDLRITDVSRRLSSNVPDVLTDIVEIATYVYCADQLITRGGEGVANTGANWRRNFIFHIPVRLSALWSSTAITDALQKTLGSLSDDTYDFRFSQMRNPAALQQYLEFGDDESAPQSIDEVLLFSGGLDSLGGAVQEAVVDRRRTALVSHRSTPKIFARQKQLLAGLRQLCTASPPLHVPVWVHKRGIDSREYTQRSRSFLYASLAFAVARIFGLGRIRFYENGVVSLNLPISEQALGSRATRTTHPQVLRGFAELFSHLSGADFAVENPFLWRTKTQIVDLVGDAGCGPLVGDSTSCMHTHAQTKEHPHCGRCSQCVWRRFAVLASRYSGNDPAQLYAVDLLTGERLPDNDLTLVESFIRTATDLGSMNEYDLLEKFGEIGRILNHVAPLSSAQVGENVVRLFRQHAKELNSVLDSGFSAHGARIRDGSLPETCAILLAFSQAYRVSPETQVCRTGCERSQQEKTNHRCAEMDSHSLADEVRQGSLNAEQARARTVAIIIHELNTLRPQMFEDESEYELLRKRYPKFLAFKIADQRPDLKLKILSIQGSKQHKRLAQELAAAHHGRKLSTIQEAWKNCKPAEFRRQS